MPNGMGRSRPTSTACTPSRFAAADASIDLMRACGCVLRRSLQYNMRGNARSSANLVAPVTLAAASTLRRALPIMRWSDDLSAIERLDRGISLLSAHARGRQLDRFVDLDVARAAAQVAGQRFLDFFTRWLGIIFQEGLSGEQKRGRAVSTLGCAEVGERFL